MQQFTLSFALSMLSSQRVKASVASAAFFGAAGALRGAAARLESFTRTIHNIQDKYPERAEKMRSSAVFHDLNKKLEAAASRAAAVHAISEQSGVMLRLEFEPPMPKSKTEAELKELAELCRMDKGELAKHIDKANDKRYAAELEASDLAASLFWTATADHDAPLRFDSVQRCIDRTRLKILTWSSPDLAELGLIASDERSLNDWMDTMCDDPSQFSENTLTDDEIEERERAAEIKALDAHAAAQRTIAYLDAERTKAADSARRKRQRIAKAKTEAA